MAADFRIETLFATPLVSQEVGDPALNATLEAAILKRRDEHPGITRSNIGGWHSEPDLLSWTGDAGADLVRRAADLATANTRDARQGAAAPRQWTVEAWANVNASGAFNQVHSHGASFWSAVYYLRTDPGEGGELVLHDPRQPALSMHAPMLRFKGVGTEQIATIVPHAGMLVLFPAWLMHHVRPWTGDGLRISIAMNLAARPRPG